MITLRINPDDFTPPYEQIRRQIEGFIRSGELSKGERLPTVRQLARDLGIAVGTVARAFKELEAMGLISTARGAGTTVAAVSQATGPSRSELAELAAQYVTSARRLGATDDDIRRCFAAAIS